MDWIQPTTHMHQYSNPTHNITTYTSRRAMEEEQKYHWRARYISSYFDASPMAIKEVRNKARMGRWTWPALALSLMDIDIMEGQDS